MTAARRQGVFRIGAIAERFAIHPQTLRLYEREGLLRPSRTDGNTRLYSDEDLTELETILALTRDLGVNLAGVEIVLNMRKKMERMQKEVNEFMVYVKRELQKGLGARDQSRLSEYLDDLREIERRIERSAQTRATDLAVPAAPIGVPDAFEDHVGLMFDLLAVAYQADITRVFTFMMARDLHNRTYPQIGVDEPHHGLSHHQNKADKIARFARINAYHVSLFGKFLDKLKATPDGDGSVLDHSVILYGSGMGNANVHSHIALPYLVAGTGAGAIQGGRHIKARTHDPNALLAIESLPAVVNNKLIQDIKTQIFNGEGPFTERPADAERGGPNRNRVRSACQEL